MTPADITPVILTYNEAPNLARCLERLRWAAQVVVLDSFSTDATVEIARDFANVRVEQRRFDEHTAQWNHGVALAATPWVLSLDADYLMPEDFGEELTSLNPDGQTDAFFARFRYCVFGSPLRATLYPPRAVLFRRDRCTYVKDGHTQLLHVPGSTQMLQGIIDHDDRKPLTRWFTSQDNYAKLEAVKLSGATGPLRLQDRLRLTLVCAPLLTLVYCLFVKGLLLDGWRGWFYTWQRVLAEVMLALRLIENRHASAQTSD